MDDTTQTQSEQILADYTPAQTLQAPVVAQDAPTPQEALGEVVAEQAQTSVQESPPAPAVHEPKPKVIVLGQTPSSAAKRPPAYPPEDIYKTLSAATNPDHTVYCSFEHFIRLFNQRRNQDPQQQRHGQEALFYCLEEVLNKRPYNSFVVLWNALAWRANQEKDNSFSHSQAFAPSLWRLSSLELRRHVATTKLLMSSGSQELIDLAAKSYSAERLFQLGYNETARQNLSRYFGFKA